MLHQQSIQYCKLSSRQRTGIGARNHTRFNLWLNINTMRDTIESFAEIHEGCSKLLSIAGLQQFSKYGLALIYSRPFG